MIIIQKTSKSLWLHCKDVAVDDNCNIIEFNGDNATNSFNFKTKITVQTGNNGISKNAEIMVALKYLNNILRTLEMTLIKCEINITLTWSKNCLIVYKDVASQGAIFEITEAKLYTPVVTLSTQNNAKFLQQLKSGFERTIGCKKYLSNPELLVQNPNLNYLVKTSFQGVNWIFVFAFENDAQRISNKKNGKKFLINHKNDNITYEKITENATGQEDYYTTGCLLNHLNFKKIYRLIAMDLQKQQALDADPRATLQISFTANQNKDGNTTIFFNLEEAVETVLDFSQGTVKVFQICYRII